MNLHDDPSLTAYALGELDENECAEVEALLENDADAREELETIRATAQLLEAELQQEPVTQLTEEQRKEVEAAIGGTTKTATRSRGWRRAAWWSAFALAASFLVVTGTVIVPSLLQTRGSMENTAPVATQIARLQDARLLYERVLASKKAPIARLRDARLQYERALAMQKAPTKNESVAPATLPIPEDVKAAENARPQDTGTQTDNTTSAVEAQVPVPPPPVPSSPPKPSEAPAAEEMGPLKIELPKPMFVGTPKNIVSDNLEPVTGKKREPFLVPKGTINLSKDKPVTSSESSPIIGELEMITDGDKEGADGSFVEFSPGVQWVQVDLGETCELFAILMWHYHSQACAYHDVVVMVSDDPDFIQGVTVVFNNDHNNSAGLGTGPDKEYIETNEGRLIDAHGVRSRYVRLYSNGNTSNDVNHMIEVEIHGRPARLDPPSGSPEVLQPLKIELPKPMSI